MATLIKVDGTKTVIVPKNKRKGFTLDEIYAALGCDTVQCVNVKNGAEENMICDEEAKCKAGWVDRINMEATRIFALTYGPGRDVIVGDVLMCNNKEWK